MAKPTWENQETRLWESTSGFQGYSVVESPCIFDQAEHRIFAISKGAGSDFSKIMVCKSLS
jgi:hypothetical protein